MMGRCNEPGPWGSFCTDYPGHRYSHYDGSADRSWQDDWREDIPPEGGGTLIETEDDDG
jgi:hypothetical protein